MEDTVIDVVRADVLEVGDITYWGIVTSLSDNGDYIVVDTDTLDGEPIAFYFEDMVQLLGAVYSESV